MINYFIDNFAWASALISGILALIVVTILTRTILKTEISSEQIRNLSKQIQDGASTFLRNQYKIVALVVFVIAILLTLVPFFIDVGKKAEVGFETAISFVIGAICSALAGYISMTVATRTNGRTTEAATRGFKPAFKISYSAGAVTGLSIAAIGLLGLILVYTLFNGKPSDISGYAMGASLMALFARTGGGIFTKGADMGADLVGKIEANIPEDDPRNPAVIADNVGDNVGDIAGLGSDLMESFVEAVISAMAIAYTLSMLPDNQDWHDALIVLPFSIVAWGMISSIAGIIWSRYGRVKDAQTSLNAGVILATIIMLIGSFFIVRYTSVQFQDEGGQSFGVLGPFWAITAGLVTGLIIAGVSLYYSDSRFKPVRKLAESARSGTAVLIVNGLNIGMISTWLPAVGVAFASLIGYNCAGMYGIGMGAMGMLSTLGITLAVDSYGPVVDNAGGIAEMTEQDEGVRKITDSLDSVGNTTAAIGKGFAIGSAAFAALALVTAYMASINHYRIEYGLDKLKLSLEDPLLVAGLIIGGAVPFFFSALLGSAVGRIAHRVVEEARRQFKSINGLMEGKASPDAAKCVDIAAKGALKSIALPGILAVVIPVAIGIIMGPEGLAGLILGGLVSGLPLAILMANTGAAYDNSKKYIEEGHYGGKTTETHKAAVVGDTVGDPLKDTMGPSIDILIKLMSITALVLAPIFAHFKGIL